MYTDIPGAFCTSFGLTLKSKDVGRGPGWQCGQIGAAAAGACRAGGAGEVPAEPHAGGRFVVGCRSCGSSPAQPGVPGALRVLWEGQGGFLTSQIGNCQK